MKMVKKLLLGLAATAAIVALVSCEGVNVGGADSIEGNIINGTTTRAYVGKKADDGITNDASGTIREMKLFATKHKGAFAALTLTGEESGKASNGQLGYVFNYTENEDGTVNFITIGFRYGSQDGTNKKFNTYVSQFYNIDPTQFSKNNFGCDATKAKYDATVKTPYEIEVATLPTDLNFVTFGTEDPTVGVEVIAEDNGSYTINYYAASKLNKYKLIKNSVVDKTITVSSDVTGRTTLKETKLGCYAAVYPGKTLKGSWRFSSIKGEDLPVEGFED